MRVPLAEPDAEVRVPRVTSVEIRAAFEFLDTVDLRATFSRRACAMKTTPHFLRGPFRNALRLAMEEAVRAGDVHQNRGWKLFLLLPRLLLHRPPRGGKVHRSKLVERFDDFARGSWRKLLEASVKCDEDAATAHKEASKASGGGCSTPCRESACIGADGRALCRSSSVGGSRVGTWFRGDSQRVEESFETSTKRTCTSTTTNIGT